jgi:hypothetical protein
MPKSKASVCRPDEHACDDRADQAADAERRKDDADPRLALAEHLERDHDLEYRERPCDERLGEEEPHQQPDLRREHRVEADRDLAHDRRSCVLPALDRVGVGADQQHHQRRPHEAGRGDEEHVAGAHEQKQHAGDGRSEEDAGALDRARDDVRRGQLERRRRQLGDERRLRGPKRG